jgi:hypothetical protein
MTPREILRRAYVNDIVPVHLHGRTQHKTLGARLSEDILLRRERSTFFRTIPGRFFLREFLFDKSIPEKHRTPIVSRRRERDLHKGAMLCTRLSDLAVSKPQSTIPIKRMMKALRQNRFRYVYANDRDRYLDALIWSFVIVGRSTNVLSYRIGRYRDGRDAFFQKRSIGFFRPVRDSDWSLFDQYDHGIVSSGIRVACLDLDLPYNAMQDKELRERSRLECFLVHNGLWAAPDILAIVRFECPDWFEPTKRRLAINDLCWLDLQTPVNDINDFDPWSQLALAHIDSQRYALQQRRYP